MKAVLEVFWRFLLLGCYSFGGPAAHLGYFRKAFVEKLQWIDDDSYAKLVALSQFLPGPGSSQVGFAIGLRKAGLAGGIAAFLGFTLPSFVLIYLAATLSANVQHPLLNGLMHGLKLLAVVVVADAVLGMSRHFCTRKTTYTLAVFTAVAMLIAPNLWVQMSTLLIAGLIGTATLTTASQKFTSSPSIKTWPLAIFLFLLLALPLIATHNLWVDLFSEFYRAGSLVFGGGHVVLPLLQQTLSESIDSDRFLLGYAFAQAVPGPMFSMATFLGADLGSSIFNGHSFLSALLATFAIFLPGFLLMMTFNDTWESLAQKPRIAGAASGINAAVVGLLLAALYDPVFTSAVLSSQDFAKVIIGFLAMRIFKIPIFILVLGFASTGLLFSGN